MRQSTAALFVLHFVANALLLWLGYYWLGLGESNGMRLAWSAVVITFLICSALCLHGTSLAYFRFEEEAGLLRAARTASRHVVPLLVVAICVTAIYGLLQWVQTHFTHWGFVTASFLTLKARRPVRPGTVAQIFSVLLWVARWLVVPALALPVAAAVAVRGWDGFRDRFFRDRRRWMYWIEVCVLLVCAVWAPLKLLAWVPEIKSFSLQMASFILRLSIGYLLFVAALLALAFVTSRGKPRLSQESTVASP